MGGFPDGLGENAMVNQIRLSAVLLMGGVIAWGGYVNAVLAADPLMAVENDAPAVAIAQTADTPEGYTVLHVNSQSGSDQDGDGSQLRPYQTITYALDRAAENTLILLAAGIYSADSGETFPLELKPQVTVQGMAGPDPADIMILGNGGYFSNSSGLRNIAILGADNAGLANVTVSNPHPEGTGLWIESGSPIILDSAFFRNGLSGIHIAGAGAPTIRGNYFLENGRAGLVIAGPSSAAIESNVFENTGTGITVAPDAMPKIENNRISRNLDGLIVHADATPTLHNNQISRNRRNSIVDYSTWAELPATGPGGAAQPSPPETSARPALQEEPTSTSVPQETAAIASPPDVNRLPAPPTAAHSVVPLPSASVLVDRSEAVDTPQAAASLSAGTVETTASEPAAVVDGRTAVVEPALGGADIEISAVSEQRPTTVSVIAVAPELSADLAETSTVLSAVEVPVEPLVAARPALETLNLAPVIAASEAASHNLPNEETPETATIESADSRMFAPLPSIEEAGDQAVIGLDHPQVDSVAIPVIPLPAEAVAKPSHQEGSGDLASDDLTTVIETTDDLPSLPLTTTDEADAGEPPLQVPAADIPMGSGGDLPELFTTAGAALTSAGPPPPPSLAASLGLNYRVLVDAADQATQTQVRQHVADAFRTRMGENTYMQVGAYPTLEEAQAQVERLNQVGLQAQIEEIP